MNHLREYAQRVLEEQSLSLLSSSNPRTNLYNTISISARKGKKKKKSFLGSMVNDNAHGGGGDEEGMSSLEW